MPETAYYEDIVNCQLTVVKFVKFLAAIPQPSGETPSKRSGSLEMPALRAEGEIRDERFWPKRGRNQGMEHTTAPMPERRLEFEMERSSSTKGERSASR